MQTAFNCLVTSIPKINANKIADVLAVNPRLILGLKKETIKENTDANLTLFTLTETSTFTEKQNVSKSKNSPLLDKSMNGRVVGIINNGKLILN